MKVALQIAGPGREAVPSKLRRAAHSPAAEGFGAWF